MTEEPSDPRPDVSRGAAGWLVAACAAFIVGSRLRTYGEPFECDITIYSVIGHEWLGGRPLYTDLWDNKPPGVHVTFALAELLFGYGPLQIFGLNLIAALASLGGLYVAGRGLTGRRSGGLWAAGLWAALSGHVGMQANQPNSEVFVNACLVGAFAVLARRTGRPLGLRWGLVAALLCTLATLYKQLAVLPVALLGIVHVVYPPDVRAPGGAAPRRRAALDVALIGLVGALAWGSVFWYFRSHGRFDDFYDAAFRFNQEHHMRRPEGQGVLGNLLRFDRLLPVVYPETWPLAALAAWAVVRGTVDLRDRNWALCTAALAGSYVMVALPGWYYPHYYQMALPWLILAAAWSVVRLRRAPPFARWDALPVVGAAALLVPLAMHVADLRLTPDEVSVKKYGPIFVEVRSAGEAAGALLEPGESMWQDSFEAGLYFWARRRPATGVVFDYALDWDVIREPLTRRILADLERDPPELVVTHEHGLDAANGPLAAWAAARYEPIADPATATGHSTFHFFARRGGRLAARLRGR